LPERTEKTTKNLRQNRKSLGQDLNPVHPKHEAGVLTIQPQCTVVGDQQIYGDNNTKVDIGYKTVNLTEMVKVAVFHGTHDELLDSIERGIFLNN
jgi:hypothetical protein